MDKLKRLTERIWYLPFEEERDRPNLGYIRGDEWSLAVDAGHSAEHLAMFYRALEEESLPLPHFTVLTHWHWDHTFALHAMNGVSIANGKTNAYLADFAKKVETEGVECFLSLHESIRKEYAGNRPVIIRQADIIFSCEMQIELGNCIVQLMQTEAPHTDDSTLVYVPGEKVLFLGDAASGTFPAWKKDRGLCRKLADTLQKIDAAIHMDSHWTPLTKEESIRDIFVEE